MPTNYRRGADLERKWKLKLEKAGWFVIRSAGSKGCVDLVAFRGGRTLFIQCKRTGKLGPQERHNLWSAAHNAMTIEPILATPTGMLSVTPLNYWPFDYERCGGGNADNGGGTGADGSGTTQPVRAGSKG